ncbi:TonB-dependent Receptor Plug Domain protein [Lacunisphaera limnophila]|uniref:TonB-dependent Receptor Plug Domain protein n=1 Tax=Lacunisphaera limnophila TaxID=1838286 RepID=A0A1D8ASC0_9BACT|nr:TonB-dependent receptor [Lacunisphaera limnophila]AOS43801.1 TonB-dependent Receptor Plug Domain protein [Lacunisphaera limnophila]
MALVLSLAFSVSSTTVFAQQTAGAIYGKVAAGSTVTVESTGTGYKRSATASAEGNYRIGSLPPGTYKVTYSDGSATQTKEADVAIGSSTLVGSETGVLELEKFVVGGLSVNPVDFSSTESVSVFNEKQIDLLPIARNPSSIALLAPGTTLGDTAFGNLVSFGGASVAENAYFVNGFNISNFRNGLDPATVPFEFYSQFEVKTGAYSAEFGRSTGGVISASTKSGTNEYKAGANVYFQPSSGYENRPDSYYKDAAGQMQLLTYNGGDKREQLTSNVFASGPLLKNKIFFYGLYQTRDISQTDVISAGTQILTQESDDPFWGAKLDIVPFDNHRLEFTAFKDKSRVTGTQYPYVFANRAVDRTATPSYQYTDRGGETKIGRYTGTFFENLTISALYGKSEQDLTDSGSLDTTPYVLDGRSGPLNYVTGNPNGTIATASDEREAMRLDAEYTFTLAGNHRLRAGFDREDNISKDVTTYSGNVYFRYYNVPSSGVVNGATVTGSNVGYVRERLLQQGGNFKVKSDAWYLEDNWTLMNDRLNLRLGVRNESFENLNGADESFITIKDQKAPRLGASYDLFGNKKTKVYMNFGRYHLPVASNTNVRLAGGELFTQDFYVLNSVGADGLPVKGAKLGGTVVLGDGTVGDTRTLVDLDIASMYQDEWVLGAQHALSKDLLVGVRFTSREIAGTAMDDMLVDHALTEWAHANGFPAFDGSGLNHYVLANPGRAIRTFWDFSENGTLEANEEAILTTDMLDYPEAIRKYYAVELTLEKVWNGKWSAQASYTWSQSYGNYEGWVLSDNGQDDAGITQLFDTPDLTINTYGKLPNDRRHQFKAFGAYALTPELSLGVNMLLSSGRPINQLVPYDDAILGGAYGVSYLGVPRGSAGTTDWQFNTDLSLVYRPKWSKDRLTFTFDMFNVLNGRAVTEVFESYQDDGGDLDYRYGAPTSWQAPRYMRLSASFEY